MSACACTLSAVENIRRVILYVRSSGGEGVCLFPRFSPAPSPSLFRVNLGPRGKSSHCRHFSPNLKRVLREWPVRSDGVPCRAHRDLQNDLHCCGGWRLFGCVLHIKTCFLLADLQHPVCFFVIVFLVTIALSVLLRTPLLQVEACWST